MNKSLLKIVLIGLPGSGKSTFGLKLAQKLDFPFIDLDAYIETKESTSIPTIFYEQGEGAFRNLETNHLLELLQQDNAFVLSTGGGTPCFNDNMDRINAQAISIYLDVPIGTIHERLIQAEGNRPLFSGLDSAEVKKKLEDLSQNRNSFYSQAKIKLSGEEISTEHVFSELLTFFRS
jgi:shikimate kinase